jgi:hypothetical protein
MKRDERYARAAQILFADLLHLVERNPHGYFPAWSFTPQADKYDTVYDPVAYERGITAFWSDQQLDLIGRDAASRFVAAQARWFVFSGQIADTFEVDNVTAIRACNHGGHTGLRNQIGIYLFDDFAFYRGLVGELIAWSAATRPATTRLPSAGTGPFRKLELSNAGSSMVRWALDIRPGSRWLESKVQRLDPVGFQLRIWSRLPNAQPVVTVRADEIGLSSRDDVLEARPGGPAFREPLMIEVKPAERSLALTVSKPVKLRLYHRKLLPGFPEIAKYVLLHRQSGGDSRELAEGVIWMASYVEWAAEPGAYELRARE